MTNPTPTEADLLASGRSFLRCGCGFLAVGVSEPRNLIAFKRHRCTTAGGSKRWYESLFTEEGYLIIAAIVSCAAVVLVAVFG